VPTPPLREQRAITGILGALDDKIELNRRMNETLEAMAQALFKRWYRQHEPSATQFSIEALIARKALQIGDGYRAKLEELGEPGLPFARAGNINNGFMLDGAEQLREDRVPAAGDKLSRAFDVVFTSKGTVGRFAFVPPGMGIFVYSPQLCFWRSLDPTLLDPMSCGNGWRVVHFLTRWTG
jgi:type I restriction enzyme S subunit